MDEKKNYSVVGTVTIGTDEYRDLIQGMAKAENDAENYRSKFWKEESEHKKADERVAELEKAIEDYNVFFSKFPEAKALYGQYTAEKAVETLKARAY